MGRSKAILEIYERRLTTDICLCLYTCICIYKRKLTGEWKKFILLNDVLGIGKEIFEPQWQKKGWLL